MFRNAQRSIDLQSFAFGDDELGHFLRDELQAAAVRGVRVRILLDAWNAGKSTAFVRSIADSHEEVCLKLYNIPGESVDYSVLGMAQVILSDSSSLNHRMHNKLLIIDDLVAVVGGRNYENDYYDISATRNFVDREALVYGSVVNELGDSFQEYWDSSLSSEVDLDVLKSGSLAVERTGNAQLVSAEARAELFSCVLSKLESDTYIDSNILDTEYRPKQIEVVVDTPPTELSPEYFQSQNATLEVLRKSFLDAKECIYLQTPYFVMDEGYRLAIEKLRELNSTIPIVVSTNSLAATDNVIAYAFAYRERGSYLNDLRIQFHEFRPFPADSDKLTAYVRKDAIKNAEKPFTAWHLCLHAKTYVIDRKEVWIGSANFDPRSAKINTELGLKIEDEALAEAVIAEIDLHIHPRNSWTVGISKERSIYQKMLSVISDCIPEKLGSAIVDSGVFNPITYTENFDLRENAECVPFYDSKFYDNYHSIGEITDAELSIREFETRLISALGGIGKDYV
jgi:phosphatidylserine/phosphatidylglycerophosphate/cardiolipin synthase-like enzyme